MNKLPHTLSSLAAGLLFGLGLAISGMLNPVKVQGFLDISGSWDPSLAFVLGAGLLVSFLGYKLAFARNKPLFDDQLHLPTKTRIDGPLIIGSAIFGVGWGLAGFCPGPAITALSLGMTGPAIFAVAMFAGMLVHDRLMAGKG